MINFTPQLFMKFQQRMQLFTQDHPKVLPFFKAVGDNAIEEGTVFAVKVTTPDGKTLESNIKLTANDVETLKLLKDGGAQN